MADNQTNRLSELLRNYNAEGAATSNLNMLAQGLRSRNKEPMNKLKPVTMQDFLDNAALATSPFPILGDAVGLGADAYRFGTDPSSRTPLNFGLSALGALPFVPPASAIFGGVLAKTAKLDQKAIAEGMEKSGRSRDDIWKETGWFKGPEGKWKFEIDDSGMKNAVPMNKWVGRNENGVPMAPTVSRAWDEAAKSLTPEAPVRVKRLFEHDDLKNAYPYGFTKTDQHQDILGLPVYIDEGKLGGAFAGDSIVLGGNLYPKDARSTTLHELQHAVQGKEGFAMGGSPGSNGLSYSQLEDTAKGIYQNSRNSSGDPLLDQLFSGSPPLKPWEKMNKMERLGYMEQAQQDIYMRLAGEAEARAVQSRMNMNQKQRQDTPPWQSYDVPWEQLIVK